jgi:hypothetical protein
MAIRIPIISDFDSKGLEKAVKQFEQLETKGEKAQFALEKAAAPAGVALLALGGAAAFATKAAIEDAAAQEQLAAVLQRQTGATDEQIAANEEFIDSLSRATATADDQLRPALAQLVNATGNLREGQNLLRAATDLAAATNTDLATASAALSKAYNGNLTALQKLDPSLRDNIKAGSSFNDVMAILAKTTGGAAADAANTTAGRYRLLQIRFGELQEEIGAKLLPIAEKLATFLTNLVDIVSANATVFVALGTAIGAIAGLIYAVNIAYAAYKAVALVTKALNFALATSFTAVQVATGIGIAVVAAGAAALTAYIVQQKALQKELDNSVDAAQEFNAEMSKASYLANVNRGDLARLGAEQVRENKARLASKDALEEWNKKANEAANTTRGASGATETFSEKLKTALGDALEKAKSNLDTAKEAFTNFATAVSTSVKAGLSFAAAYQSMQAATQNAGKASAELKDAQADLAKAISKGDIDDIAKAQERLTAAQVADAKAAEENKQTFLGRIAAQVEGVKEYAANLQTLLQRGLSQDALKYVLDAGAEAGSAIARELVAGNTELITGPEGVNAMVAAAQAAADAVGLNAASRWYQAGIDQATQIVDGLDATLKRLTPKLMARMDAIAASLKRTVDVTVRITESVTRIVSEIGQGKIPKLAEGGIVTKPTLALIGEAGPEAVVPLSRLGTGGGVTVNVNGGLATSAEIGQAVVNAIRAYNRSAGPANIAVA